VTLADSERDSHELALLSTMGRAAHTEINSLLKQVSRSFYLTLRILPRCVRPQIGLAYMLARATDTIADTTVVPPVARLQTLAAFRDRILGASDQPVSLAQFHGPETQSGSPAAGSAVAALPAEQIALARIEEFVAALRQFSADDQELITQVLSIIITGQELDLRRFAEAGPAHILSLRSEEELDDYTYRVAGCVGEFWTRICRAHVFPGATVDEALLLKKGVRFGKGLQLVNVLRDLPADLRQGRCYLPEDRLVGLGLKPADLLKMDSFDRLRPLYSELLAVAESHLEQGWEYTNMLPGRLHRTRLACAWPILIGVATISKLRTGNVLDASHRIKVSRSKVRKLILRATVGAFVPRIWDGLFAHAKLV
jgi:farnesyl-diphosphate farnesyltransferase